MQKYVIKNLDLRSETEVRIYKVSKEGMLNIPPNYHSLDPLNNSAAVYLSPGYDVSDVDAISHAGIVTVEIQQSTLAYRVGIDPTTNTTAVDTDKMFIDALRNNVGLEVFELQPWSAEDLPS